MARLALVTIVVDDYDTAIAYYVGVLGFTLVEDTRLSEDKRWVVVKPAGSEAGLLLARAANDRQTARIGDQTGGRVGFFLHIENFDAEYSRLLSAGVRFVREPHDEEYGRVVVFEDLYGNQWDMIQPS